MPISGGKFTGGIFVGDKLHLWSDAEGGNIDFVSKDGNNIWCFDANDNTQFRIFHYLNNELKKFHYFSDECIVSGGDLKTSAGVSVNSLNSILGSVLATLPQYASNYEYLSDALSVVISTDPFSNPPGRVNTSTSNRPNNCNRGIREVMVFDTNNVVITLKGWNTANTSAMWINTYLNGLWSGWKEL